MTATATKPATAKKSTTKKPTGPAKRAPATAKPATSVATRVTPKPAPPAKVAAYIGTLASTNEQRYATKVWRHLAGHRKSQGTPRGITQEQAKTIRERVNAAIA